MNLFYFFYDTIGSKMNFEVTRQGLTLMVYVEVGIDGMANVKVDDRC